MPESRPPPKTTSDFRLFGDFKSVVDLDTQVPHGRLQLGVAEQKLHGSEVLGASIDQRRLCPSHRMCTVLGTVKHANTRDVAAEHQALLEAALKRDTELATKLLEQHFQATSDLGVTPRPDQGFRSSTVTAAHSAQDRRNHVPCQSAAHLLPNPAELELPQLGCVPRSSTT